MRVNFIIENIKRFNSNSQKNFGRAGYGLFRVWASEVYCFIRYGCSPDDYFRYEFYRKSGYERNKLITYRRSQRLIKQYNDLEYIQLFGNKKEFNERFSMFIGREWLDLAEASTKDLEEFLQKHGSILVKPAGGGQGKGIFKIGYSDLSSFDINNHRDAIAEEIIQQHPSMAELNPTSVNTVRVLTFKGQVVACALRIGGTGAVVDNLHSKGVCAHLDIEMGLIDSPCINNQLEHFLSHPGSGKTLVGFKVPNWDKVIRTAREAAKQVLQVQYVGWDIAVTKDGAVLIEGNHDPGHDVVQMIAQTGLYSEIRNLEKQKIEAVASASTEFR